MQEVATNDSGFRTGTRPLLAIGSGPLAGSEPLTTMPAAVPIRRDLVVRRMVVVAIRENPGGLALRIVELVVAESPEEPGEREATQRQRSRNEDDEDVHDDDRGSRMAFSTTTIELADMKIAARSGVTSPARATGTATTL